MVRLVLAENSGTIPATVTPNWTLCAGGTITVNYTGVDDCGNTLSGSSTIAVTPAPPAVLTLPALPTPLIVLQLLHILLLRMLLIQMVRLVLARTVEHYLELLLPTGHFVPAVRSL
jgi:hypothetical protein